MPHLIEINEEHDDKQEILFLEGVVRRLPQHTQALKTLGDLYTRVGRCEDGLIIDLQLVELCPDEDIVWYNLACSHALTDNTEAALSALEKAVTLGYDDAEWMQSDPDLESLRHLSRFDRLICRVREECKQE